jgi:uncharacterized protein
MKFNSTILILPGLGNSGEQHWQTIWEKLHPEFIRVNQSEWENPICEDWIATIEAKVQEIGSENVILVGHSLACSTIGFWVNKYKTIIKGALIVAPSDTEAETYPTGTTGFTPMPSEKLPFKSIMVYSTDDYYVSTERALYFGKNWGSEIVSVGDAKHINAESNLGEWHFGLELLKQLDS